MQGKELTAYDLARAKGHAECEDILRQHGGKSAVNCRANSKVRREAGLVVQQAHDAAAREAQYCTDITLHYTVSELFLILLEPRSVSDK